MQISVACPNRKDLYCDMQTSVGLARFRYHDIELSCNVSNVWIKFFTRLQERHSRSTCIKLSASGDGISSFLFPARSSLLYLHTLINCIPHGQHEVPATPHSRCSLHNCGCFTSPNHIQSTSPSNAKLPRWCVSQPLLTLHF